MCAEFFTKIKNYYTIITFTDSTFISVLYVYSLVFAWIKQIIYNAFTEFQMDCIITEQSLASRFVVFMLS